MSPHLDMTHVRLLVSDMKACYRFYREVLGLEPLWGDGEGTYASFKAANVALALFQRQAMAGAAGTIDKPSRVESQDPLALIFEVDDVDTAVQQLEQKGVRFVTQPQDRPDWGICTAHFRDPDGTLIEIYTNL